VLTHLSLFTGIGGIDLAAERAGFTTLGQCEYADYPTKVLEKRWPAVPRWRDIRSVTAEDFHRRTGRRTVDLISGGFPCQPFSVAGNRKGKDDDRYLWPEMLRVISELKPTWVIGENVAGIVNMALEQVCIDLENQGYEVQPFIIPACSINAPHRRERIFIVANSASSRLEGFKLQGYGQIEKSMRQETFTQLDFKNSFDYWIDTAPGILRSDNGVSADVDSNSERYKALGNAVVPAQIYPVLKAIYDIEVQNGL
jgi:DNA (cytosine-5)-methyltransferase 1